tara:strand:+ start:386 stop:784 length:399 start_codon:yes stop_codon:yes gene_type:complete
MVDLLHQVQVEMVETLYLALELLYTWLLSVEVQEVRELGIHKSMEKMEDLEGVVVDLMVEPTLDLALKHQPHPYLQTLEHTGLEIMVEERTLTTVAVAAVALAKLETLMIPELDLLKDKVGMENNIQRSLAH